MHVCDEIYKYHISQSLSWPDFLEAIVRTAYITENKDTASKRKSALDSFHHFMKKNERIIKEHIAIAMS